MQPGMQPVMRPVLWGLLGLLVCLPVAFVLLILTAAKYSAMDAFTMKLQADLLSDREYLAVAYDRTNQSAKATAICTKAPTGWKPCHCELTETAVKCSNAPAATASKK